ncbi:MAG: aminopeptidase [Palaeococcus sp.]|nr:aminopeptidase [Palaeococcus sp. (in: euryarchaeotes)]
MELDRKLVGITLAFLFTILLFSYSYKIKTVEKSPKIEILYPPEPNVYNTTFEKINALNDQNYTINLNITARYFPNNTIKGTIAFEIVDRKSNIAPIYIAFVPNLANITCIKVDSIEVNTTKLSYYLATFEGTDTKVLILNVSAPRDASIRGFINYTSTYEAIRDWGVGTVLTSIDLVGYRDKIKVKIEIPRNYEILPEPDRTFPLQNRKVVEFYNKPNSWPFFFIFPRANTKTLKVGNLTVTIVFQNSTSSSYCLNRTIEIIQQTLSTYSEDLGRLHQNKIAVIFYPKWPYYTGQELALSPTTSAVILGSRGGLCTLLSLNPDLFYHELAHLWFGGYADFGRINESLATFMNLYMRVKGSRNLDGFEGSALQYINYSKTLAEIYKEGIFNSQARAGIVYYKGAFVFRSLQFVLGNETFFKSLRELLRECHGRECNLTDVQNVFEEVSGQDLDWFFKEWFYSTRVPDYEIENLSVTQRDDKYFLTFEIIDKNNFTMPLEVEVTTSKEKLVKKVWIKGKAKVSFELNDKPTKIILDPNEWMVNKNKKYNVKGMEIEIN